MERPRSVMVFLVALAVVAGPTQLLAHHAGGRAAVATPSAPAAGAGSLPAMLGRVPDVLAGPDPPAGVIASYSNIAAQLAAVGVAAPSSIDDEAAVVDWLRAVRALVFPHPKGQSWAGPEWRATYGFEIFAVDQALQISKPDGEAVTLLRGRFDAEELRTAWERSGYRPVDVEGVAVAAGDLPRSELNHAVVLSDGTLVFASSLDDLQRVLAVAAGREPALTDLTDVATLLGSARTDLASALLLTGEALHQLPLDLEFYPRMRPQDVEAIDTALAESGSMPPVALALLGVTPGGPLLTSPSRAGQPTPTPEPPRGPPARLAIALLTENEAAAAAAVPVITARLATVPSLRKSVPYAELFADSSVRATPGSPVVLIDLDFAEDNLVAYFNWLELFLFEDLLFVAW